MSSGSPTIRNGWHESSRRNKSMPKRPKPTETLTSEIKPECLELLNEFLKAFQSIPQRYCLFCEANAGLGIEAHKPDCPFRRASELVRTSQSTPQKKRLPSALKRTLSRRWALYPFPNGVEEGIVSLATTPQKSESNTHPQQPHRRPKRRQSHDYANIEPRGATPVTTARLAIRRILSKSCFAGRVVAVSDSELRRILPQPHPMVPAIRPSERPDDVHERDGLR